MIRESYSAIWSLTLKNVKWHSDPWSITVTSQPIRLSTNFVTLIPSVIFTESRVWHASRERLPFQTHVSVPLFGTCLCSNGWDQFSRNYRVFSRLFTLNTLRYFLDFALNQKTTFLKRFMRDEISKKENGIFCIKENIRILHQRLELLGTLKRIPVVFCTMKWIHSRITNYRL